MLEGVASSLSDIQINHVVEQYLEIILGFLIGAVLDASPGIARHALTIRYDEHEKQWRAYDGPLARWMRDKALEAEPAFG